MTEDEWLRCSDVEAMLHHLWDQSPEMKWSDRRPLLLVCACCRAVAGLFPAECRELLAMIGRWADEPVGRSQMDDAFDAAERAAEQAGGDPWQVVTAIGYDDLGLVCYVAAQMIAAAGSPEGTERYEAARRREQLRQADCVRDIFGNPFRPVTPDPTWLNTDVVNLTQTIYDRRSFDRLPELADALRRAGCTEAEILEHCHQMGEHGRGCWVVDLLLGKA